MKFSFLVTTHNEDSDLNFLLKQLCDYKKENDCEIVVLDDYSDNPHTLKILDKFGDYIRVVKNHLNKNFGNHKQIGNDNCDGDYILQLDADEYLSEQLLSSLPSIVDSNSDIELFFFPRVNIIRNMTEKRAAPWGWHVTTLDMFDTESEYHDDSEEYQFLKKYNLILSEMRISDTQMNVKHYLPIINWNNGDYQGRLYKNLEHIRWVRPLHEFVDGAKVTTRFPKDPLYSIIHDKQMDKQEKQNQFYNAQFSKELNVRNANEKYIVNRQG